MEELRERWKGVLEGLDAYSFGLSDEKLNEVEGWFNTGDVEKLEQYIKEQEEYVEKLSDIEFLKDEIRDRMDWNEDLCMYMGGYTIVLHKERCKDYVIYDNESRLQALKREFMQLEDDKHHLCLNAKNYSKFDFNNEMQYYDARYRSLCKEYVRVEKIEERGEI